jgi:tripartite-type tricarboxylate transporter receptor subunit TctC
MLRVAVAVCAAIALLPGPGALAQDDYPARQITLVVPTSAGGPTDVLARLVAQKMSERWNQTVIVENRSGSNSMLGVRAVASAAPDGYRLLVVNDGPMAMNPGLYKDIGYDPIKDFTAISNVAWSPLVLVVNPTVPAVSITELLDHLRKHPGKLNYAAGGPTTQLAAELFKKMTGTTVQGVIFRGSAQAIPNVVSGEVQMMVDAIASSLPLIQAGRLRALAVAGSERSSILPGLPTISEAGVPGYSASTWLGLFAPAGLPDKIRDKIQQEVARIVALPDVKDRIPQIGLEPVGSSSSAFAHLVRNDLEKWAGVIRDIGLQPQ